MPSHNSNLVFFKNLTACFYCFTLFDKVKIKVLFVQIFGVKQTKKRTYGASPHCVRVGQIGNAFLP